LIFSKLDRASNGNGNLKILDAGCGTGYVLSHTDRHGLSFGIDISDIALGYCRMRGTSRLARASVEALPFGNESFDIIVSADVICQDEVSDDKNAINEFHRTLKKEGILIINVSAYRFLRRRRDRYVHMRRRYTTQELGAKLRDCGFKVRKMTYRCTAPFFIALIFKPLVDRLAERDSHRRRGPRVINFLLGLFLKAENILLKAIDMPVGTSVFCVSEKA
jgi:SAM-dependent methyltransferase